MKHEYGAMVQGKTEVLGEIPVTVPLCLPQTTRRILRMVMNPLVPLRADNFLTFEDTVVPEEELYL